MFIVGFFAALLPGKVSAVAGPPPTNYATLQFEHMFKAIGRHFAIGAVKLQLALDRLTGFRSPVFGLGITADEQILESLKSIGDRVAKLSDIEAAVAKQKTDQENVTKLIAEIQKDMLDVRKAQLALRQNSTVRPKGGVSDECAKYIGALFIKAGVEQGKFTAETPVGQRLVKMCDEIVGKTAVTSSDIPLPTQYSGEVIELVGEYGAARRYCTVFPLGTGTVKLPKLTTDPTFGLIAGSGAVGEKVPVISWVTFTAEKFGGIVRLPSEIEEDSIIAVGQFVARYSARQLAYLEDYQVFRSTGAGSGINGTAEGLTKSVVTDSKTLALAAGDLAIGDVTLAKVRALRAVVDAAALRMGAYYFHPSMEQKLASFNTAGDKPYQANGLNGATLDGFPIRWLDVMPVYSAVDAASTVFGLFGDVSFAYLGVRGGVRFDVSRDVYFATDEVGIRALERMTTGKMATGAVAGLITAAA